MDLRMPLSLLVLAGSIGVITAVPIDCSVIRCGLPPNCNPEDIFTPPGQCCAICRPDCSTVRCAKPQCKEGEVIETPPGECCPVCTRPDCAAVLCLDQDCDDGEVLVTPPGECCARCQQDCSAVSCLRPVCKEGDILKVPEGECCPICIPGVDCSAVLCLRPVCEEGETIKVPEGECCPICAKKVCKLRCPPGHRCEVDKGTGKTFCNPDCELDNGGCSSDEICSLLSVLCVRAPCPPTVQCSACKLRCPPGHRCEVDNGETFCKPDCELDNGGCSSDQICSLVPVVCVQAPCPTKTVQCSCPPECSRDYCTANRKGLCSNPAYNNILPRPGCTGSCRLTYCSACVFGVENPTIPSCTECADYSSPNKCYEKWSQCIGRRFQDQVTSDAVFCASPPCFRRG